MSVIVVGSANLDVVYRVERIPTPGETVLAASRTEHPGGKGNNQAIAAARAGAATAFIGALGDDEAGAVLRAGLEDAGVNCLVRTLQGPSGTALIVVSDDGENTIVVDGGANRELIGLTTDENRAISAASFLLLQLETPLDTVTDAARIAHELGTVVVLNASPIRELPDGLISAVDVLLVNEHEAALIAEVSGRWVASGGSDDPTPGSDVSQSFDPAAIAAILLERVPAVVITLGAKGSYVASREIGGALVPGIRVDAVDTTGAGDTFSGAFVAALAEHGDRGASAPLLEAAHFATAAAALSVQREGAVSSIPTREEIDAFRAQR
jgi:ribokinase